MYIPCVYTLISWNTEHSVFPDIDVTWYNLWVVKTFPLLQTQSEEASDTLHYLSCLSPALVIPSVVERLFASFELVRALSQVNQPCLESPSKKPPEFAKDNPASRAATKRFPARSASPTASRTAWTASPTCRST